MPSTYSKGRVGEDAACNYLMGLGYLIFERNYRFAGAEVDIIAGDGDTICFCEVKAWTGIPVEDLFRSVNYRKRSRIIRAAQGYLASHGAFTDWHVRFDVLFFQGTGTVPQHFKHAFDAQG